MSMKNQAYNPICEDGYDNKIPLHNDEAFQHGIQFKVKFIGSLEVQKPTSRGEIVASMRRIRHEFKARSVKKRSVNLSISVDGVKISLWKKNKKHRSFDQDRAILMQYPIHRVFYVSHDSQDLKIFSFIARDTTNTFRCHVFKAYKKNEAIHIVRTIGQAFEVCHKLSLQQTNQCQHETKPLETSLHSIEKPERYLQSIQLPISPINHVNLFQSHSSSEFTLKHQMQFMQEQLQQMQNESEVAFNQIKVIQEQLNIEITARIDSQNKNKQLIERNRQLLTHIQQLLVYTHQLEMKLNPNSNDLVLLPSLINGISTQQDLSSDSPDSGKGKEISSESISEVLQSSIHDQQINNSWNINNNNNNNCLSILDDITSPSISINEIISKTNDKNYEEYSSTSSSCSSINQNPIEHYLYDHIIPTESSSFTNSAFKESPLRVLNKSLIKH